VWTSGDARRAEAYHQIPLYGKRASESPRSNYYRPRNAAIASEFQARFPPINLFTVQTYLASLTATQKTHFGDGGTFDQIYHPTVGGA